MSEEQLAIDESSLSPWQRHKFMVLIGLTIVTSLFLVGVALALYASSGAAQLDLSRPGYKSVREQAVRSDSFEGFSASGSVDKDALNEFRNLYDSQSKQATNFDSFGGDVMSDKTLSIDAPAK
jgi:hypothetical protein